VLLYLLPVKAVDLLFDPQELMTISNATKQKVAAEYGFNKPALVQYGDRLWAALHGNFGTSVQSGAPVWKAIGDVFRPRWSSPPHRSSWPWRSLSPSPSSPRTHAICGS